MNGWIENYDVYGNVRGYISRHAITTVGVGEFGTTPGKYHANASVMNHGQGFCVGPQRDTEEEAMADVIKVLERIDSFWETTSAATAAPPNSP